MNNIDVIKLDDKLNFNDPAMNAAISSAILKQVSDGDLGETFRLYRPKRAIAFAPRDIRDDNYQNAVKIALKNGFLPIKRLTGGRAAVFHEGTLGFSWTIPDQNPRFNVDSRFANASNLVKQSLSKLGFDARIGEVAGEYCKGKYSVNLNGKLKVMGVGQKLAPHACHIGGVLVINNSTLIRSILISIYKELKIDWKPETAGALDDVKNNISIDDVQESILNCLKSTKKPRYRKLSKTTMVTANDFIHKHKETSGSD